MRAHVLQHVPFEGLGCIEPWLEAARFDITRTRLFESAAYPEPGDIDLLVVMGGPMSVHDREAYPWLIGEMAFVRRCIEGGMPVLGICLGAQLIADVLGARVLPNGEKEIGWFPIQAVPPVDETTFRFPESLDVFHWHGETFDLPPGAIRLARSEGCENQAFQVGQSIIGLQFHLETTPESARALVDYCGADVVPAAFVQSADEILSVQASAYAAINSVMAEVLSYLSSGAAG